MKNYLGMHLFGEWKCCENSYISSAPSEDREVMTLDVAKLTNMSSSCQSKFPDIDAIFLVSG